MKSRFQFILSITIFLLITLGFATFIYIVRVTTYNILLTQTLNDNRVIGESILQLLKENVGTVKHDAYRLDRRSNFVQEVQGVCDILKLPNAGFVCASDRDGNLIAAPGLSLNHQSKIDRASYSTIKKSGHQVRYRDLQFKNELSYASFYQDSAFEGFYEYPEEEYSDVVVGITHQSGLKLLIHQDHQHIQQLAYKESRKLIGFGLGVAIGIALITFIIVHRQIKQYQRKILAQQKSLEEAYLSIQAKNKDINDSIRYAKDIQFAVLPRMGQFTALFKDSFLLYQPKQIVSGDFYWLHQTKDQIIVALADCTGHGVPGALMAMIGNSLLERAFLGKQIANPAEALQMMHLELIRLLHTNETKTLEGMDISIVCIDKNSNSFVFAGASQHLYHISSNAGLVTYKGNKGGLGGRRKTRIFQSQHIVYKPGDWIYLSTDGIIDQPNKQRKRLGSVMLKQLLNECYYLPAKYQLKHIEHELSLHASGIPARDDMSLIGIQL